MNRQTINLILGISLLLVFGGSACQQTAAEIVAVNSTAHPDLISTVQADQYWRDAQATTQSHQLTLEANYANVAGTAQSATGTTASQQTRETLDLALTSDAATAQAQETQAAATNQAMGTATTQARYDTAATSTSIAETTAVAFTATRQAFELEQARSQARREQLLAYASYILFVSGVILALFLGGWFCWRVIPTMVRRFGLVRYGQHGNPLLLFADDEKTIVTDPLRMLQAALTISEDGTVTMPEMTPNQIQTLVTGGVLQTLIEQARYAPGHPPQLLTETISEHRIGPATSIETTRYSVSNNHRSGRNENQFNEVNDRIALPQNTTISWEKLYSYSGEGLAFGMSANDIISLDLNRTPHVLLAGTSGAGKTRRILRPVVAQALVQGTIVVLVNESGADFSPFYSHPHAVVVGGSTETYIALLEAALQEMNRRETVLRIAQVSEWSRLPKNLIDAPPVLIVIDEVLSLSLLLSSREQKLFWGLLAAYASRARKLSMGSIGALTDPTYRVLGPGLNWREQCTARITFRVAKAAVSRAVLDTNGAEQLEDGQFLAMLGNPNLIQGMATNPTDEELIAYLSQNPPPAPQLPDWIP